MLQSFLVEPYHFEYKQTHIPEPKAGEVLIRLTQVGVCGSDVRLFKNGPDLGESMTIGHEGIGIIEKVGENVDSKRIGERIVIEPNIPCMECRECRSGKVSICRNKRIIGVKEPGCFAEYIALPSPFAHYLPDRVSDEDAVAVEPATVGLAALKRSRAKSGDTIAVLGLGAIGMLLTHIALKMGYHVLVSEINPEKVEKAVRMGAVHLKARDERELEESWDDANVVSVFECAGTARTATHTIAAAPRGAEVVLLGLSSKNAEFNPLLLSRKGNTILPSLIYDHPLHFQECIELVTKGIIQPGMIVSKYFPLKELGLALTEAEKGIENKIVIRISE